MEHKRRVRKVQERPDTATLMGLLMENANDMMAENEQLRGEIERLKQHEQDMDQCDPDTVMARVESQLWVAGDLGLLRDAMVLQTRGRRRKHFPMERKDRKRKALEPLIVSERITELTSELKQNDAMLREEIEDLRDEVGSLKKQLQSKSEESDRFQAEAAFLHPDAVVDRVRTKFWHHGDLSLLRRAIDPRTRVLRNTEGRCDRSLYLCDTAPKKAGGKAPVNDGRLYELSPKEECEEASTSAPAMTEVVNSSDAGEEKQQEEADYVNVPPVSEDDAQAKTPPQLDTAATVLMSCPE